MYKVVFKNGVSTTISDKKAELVELYRKQGMLTNQQNAWLQEVKEIKKIRDEPDEHTLAMTKDMVCRCSKCTSGNLAE